MMAASLVSGKNPAHETLTFTIETELTGINSLRLEALADPSLVKKGPGRATNGNFALTDISVTAGPKGGKAIAVKLKNPRSTFDQKGLGVAGAIDSDKTNTAWAIDPQFGFDHAASFELRQTGRDFGHDCSLSDASVQHQCRPWHRPAAAVIEQLEGSRSSS